MEASIKDEPLLDVSTSDSTLVTPGTIYLGVNADQVHSTYDGTDVIVGIVDSGIDWDHGDFVKPGPLQTSRILSIWDQTLTPDGNEANPSGYTYGVEYTQAHLNGELVGNPTVSVRHQPSASHGTHVAGIAAGDGSATGDGKASGTFAGMAPGADLIIVGTTFFRSTIVDGVNYIMTEAQNLGRPAVVNLSIGGLYGPHDGTDSYETALSSACGTGKMVVIAAGNSNNSNKHAEATYTEDAVITTFSVGTGITILGIDLWHTGGDGYTCTISAPGGGSVSTGFESEIEDSAGDDTVYIYNANGDPSNSDEEVYIEISAGNSGALATGTWSFALSSRSPSSGDGHFDAWLFYPSAGPYFTSNVSNGKLVTEPGNAVDALCVASYNTKSSAQGDLSYFSSNGPTRDGRQKPEIAAPGGGIYSAIPTSGDPEDGQHGSLSGTSMAAPHVVGAVALLLDKYPTSSLSQIRDWVISTARTDYYASGLPDYAWGHGKLDTPLLVDTALPVVLAAFSAEAAEGEVILHWRTASEVANLGFHLYRATQKEGPYERITAELIEGAGNTASGRSYTFVDGRLEDGRTYWYKLEDVAFDETIARHGPMAATPQIQREEAPLTSSPDRYDLSGNVPNPFNPWTTISYQLPEAASVHLTIYTLTGQVVRTLVEGTRPAGTYRVIWDGLDEAGRQAANGVYLYALNSEDFFKVRKMVLVR
ncbi:MAG: S8 family serine peptidase [Candidatus Latescibacterota bacterium]